MLKPRVILLFSALLAAVLAAGSAYALSAEEEGHDSGAVSALQEPTPTVQAQDDDDIEDAVEAAEQDDVDDETTSDGPGNGGLVKAELLAAEFGVSADAVLALHDQGIGWGALFKLYAFARAKGVTVDDLVAAAPTDASGEKEFAFGEMKKSLTAEEATVLADGPKNLGQLVSGNHKNGHKDTP
jgi:hypothetical protein